MICSPPPYPLLRDYICAGDHLPDQGTVRDKVSGQRLSQCLDRTLPEYQEDKFSRSWFWNRLYTDTFLDKGRFIYLLAEVCGVDREILKTSPIGKKILKKKPNLKKMEF